MADCILSFACARVSFLLIRAPMRSPSCTVALPSAAVLHARWQFLQPQHALARWWRQADPNRPQKTNITQRNCPILTVLSFARTSTKLGWGASAEHLRPPNVGGFQLKLRVFEVAPAARTACMECTKQKRQPSLGTQGRNFLGQAESTFISASPSTPVSMQAGSLLPGFLESRLTAKNSTRSHTETFSSIPCCGGPKGADRKLVVRLREEGRID